VLQASPDRVTPRCPHFGTCGGCVLQHLAEDKQIEAKQRVLLDNLQRIGHVTPQSVLPPLTGDSWGYRRKGRFSVRRVEKKDKTLVGFREQDPRFVADLSANATWSCRRSASRSPRWPRWSMAWMRARDIPQIEFIAGDAHVALVFRHLQPLSDADRARLDAFGTEHGFAMFLQPGGNDSVHPLSGEAPQLSFRLPQWDIELAFRPLDFIQVNAKLNEKMIARALELLDVRPGERVLDLFCGLGNFTLPLARRRAMAMSWAWRARPGWCACPRECRAQRPGQRAVPCRGPDPGPASARRGCKAGFDKLLLDPAAFGRRSMC
jgi:23S rRNA (uracil1939-C5)-methyltransferase